MNTFNFQSVNFHFFLNNSLLHKYKLHILNLKQFTNVCGHSGPPFPLLVKSLTQHAYLKPLYLKCHLLTIKVQLSYKT